MEPKVIFFDAVGTLFDVKGSVGEVYSTIARLAGVNVSPESLEQAFRASFKSSSPLAFPEVDLEKIPQLEFKWWEAIGQSTFAQVGVLEQFQDFSAFFKQLYSHFATAEPWYIYPDTLPALKSWQLRGVELGIISNFDSRLHRVLEELELKQFFTTISIASTTGAAKPDQLIFRTALAKHRCSSKLAWHVGDSWQEDYQGAKAVGMKGFWLDRANSSTHGTEVVQNLIQLG